MSQKFNLDKDTWDVIKLYFDNNNLNGSIPNSICQSQNKSYQIHT